MFKKKGFFDEPKIMVNFVERKGDKFYYIDYGSETHGKVSFRLWVNGKLVKEENGRYYIDAVAKNRTVVKTQKGNYILKEQDNTYVFVVGWKCGFRGDSYYEIQNKENVLLEIPFAIYNSPRGSTGISRYALVVADAPLKVKEWRNGRLYGEPAKRTIEYDVENVTQVEKEIVDDPELERELIWNNDI